MSKRNFKNLFKVVSLGLCLGLTLSINVFGTATQTKNQATIQKPKVAIKSNVKKSVQQATPKIIKKVIPTIYVNNIELKTKNQPCNVNGWWYYPLKDIISYYNMKLYGIKYSGNNSRYMEDVDVNGFRIDNASKSILSLYNSRIITVFNISSKNLTSLDDEIDSYCYAFNSFDMKIGMPTIIKNGEVYAEENFIRYLGLTTKLTNNKLLVDGGKADIKNNVYNAYKEKVKNLDDNDLYDFNDFYKDTYIDSINDCLGNLAYSNIGQSLIDKSIWLSYDNPFTAFHNTDKLTILGDNINGKVDVSYYGKKYTVENDFLKDGEYYSTDPHKWYKWSNNVWNDIRNGVYRIGMTKDMVIMSIGHPDRDNRSVYANEEDNQWVYDYDNPQYLYFENGILTSFQD